MMIINTDFFDELGVHKVVVEYGGTELHGSPFTVDVFDPALVRVNSTGRAYLSKPFSLFCKYCFTGLVTYVLTWLVPLDS